MKFGVVVFPGSNCDQDCAYAVHSVLGADVRMIWHKETSLEGVDLLIIPGGFSFGDYLRTGAIARFSPVMDSVKKYARNGGLIIGICNGFQILVESRLLPGALLRNRSLRFVCRDVMVRVENTDSPFTSLYRKGELLKMPVAHAEGNYFCDDRTLRDLQVNQQIIFRYAPGDNPNGSLDDIAGICNRERNVLGLMPHPDRSAESLLGSDHGKRVFQSMMDYMSSKV